MVRNLFEVFPPTMGISNQSAVWINDFSRFSKILPEDPMSRAMMDGDAL